MWEKTSVRLTAGMFGRIREIRLILPPIALCCFTLAAFPPQSSSPLELESVELPAAGRQATYLTVNGFGRYSLRVQSESGTGLQLVDHMAGPGQVAGSSGEEDGRLDAFLERGRYKLITWGHEEAEGIVRLQAESFSELHPDPLQLVELKPVQSQLRDLEQVSYWIDIPKRRPIALEAAGRSLADLRLWKDGSWLLEAAPEQEVVQPRNGQPVLICRLSTVLDPGLYRLTAYGGPSQPWAEESDEYPFHLRWGIAQRPEASRSSHELSPFGIDRWLVPGSANFVRLEVPQAQPLRMTIGQADADNPFQEQGRQLVITRKLIPPAVEAAFSPSRQSRTITIRGQSGQPYLLQHFLTRPTYALRGSGTYWVSTVHSGAVQDSIDVTGVLVPRFCNTQRRVPATVQAVEIGPSQGWARRFNLLQRTTLHVRASQSGEYLVEAEGAVAEVRFEPFWVTPPRDYQAPPFQPAGTPWQLERGLYLLSVVPRQKGIVTLRIRPAPGLADRILNWAGLGAEEAGGTAVTGSFRSIPLRLDPQRSYSLYLNVQPGVASGLVLRRFPLDLTQALPLTQEPGEEVSLAFLAGSRQQVRAETDSGELLEISVERGPWVDQAMVDAGRYRLRVRNDTGQTAVYSLLAVPESRLDSTSLPDLPRGRLESIELPVLSPLQTAYFDLQRKQRLSFRVEVPEAGLYRLETTGLLHTSGNLRTRTVPVLFQESANGVGRNFLIQQYLSAGDYQISVEAQGRSKGHLGLGLQLGKMMDGGNLTEGLATRTTLTSGRAQAYSFEISNGGEHCLASLGLGRMHRFRLEGEDGFPLLAAQHREPVCHSFQVGRYRMVLLPEALQTRRLTLLEHRPEAMLLTGKGPHRLPLDRPIEHLWLEAEEGREQRPDVWEFDLPADVEARLVLGGEMQGQIFRAGEAVPLAAVPPSRGWSGPLQAGAYRLEVRALRRNNRAPYQLALHPTEMVAGMQRTLKAPASIPLSLGQHPAVELSSLGSQDVSARLYDAEGRLVAQNDDRPDDWNFHILRNLPPGRYSLQVDPVGVEEASCIVSLQVPQSIQEQSLRMPARRRLELGRETRLFPLRWPSSAELLLIRAESSEGVGLALEAEGRQGWKVLVESQGRRARLEIPLASGGSSAVRLRLWSLDGRGHAVELRAAAVRPRPLGEDDLASGAPLQSLKEIPAAVQAFDLRGPGLFEFPQASAGLRYCPRLGAPCRAVESPAALFGERLWLISDASPATISGRRVRLDKGAELALKLPPDWPVRMDLAPGGEGPAALLVQTRGGQPGIRLASAQHPSRPALSAMQMAVDEGAALAVSPYGGADSAWLWTAQPAHQVLDIGIKRWDFAPPAPEALDWGQWSDALQGNSVRRFDLPPGSKRLRLVLGEGVAAALSQGRELASLHWRQGASHSETLETQSDRLLLLNLGPDASPASLEIFPMPDSLPPTVLSAENPLERSMSSSGSLRLSVPARADRPAQARIRLRGATEGAVLLSADGQVYKGRELPLGPQGGTLIIPHEPGWLLAFVDLEGQGSPATWPQGLPEAEAALPQILALQGTARSWRFQLSEPSLVELRTSSPLVLRWEIFQGASSVELLPQGGNRRRYLPAGLNRLSLRALGGGELGGSAELLASPVEPIGEGLGPQVLLAPGATRLYSFQVRRSGPVGIGVRADPDVVQARLLDLQGNTLAQGVVEMVRLEPGTYLLSLTAPPGGVPVSVRPAVVGIELPPDGPPREVIERYLRFANQNPE